MSAKRYAGAPFGIQTARYAHLVTAVLLATAAKCRIRECIINPAMWVLLKLVGFI